MSQPRAFGRLLADSLALTQQSGWVCLALVAAGLIPGILLTAALLPAGATKEAVLAAAKAGDLSPLLAWGGIGLVDRLARSFTGVAVVAALQARAQGGEAELGPALGVSAGLYGAYLAAILLSSLWILGGLLLFLIPGIILALRYLFVGLAVIVEGRRGGAALERSAALWKAYPVAILGNMAGAGVVIFLAGAAATFLVALALKLSSVPAAVTTFASGLAAGAAGVWGLAFFLLLFRDLSGVAA